MKSFDEMYFEVRVKNLENDVQDFAIWIPDDGSEPDDFYGGYTYQAWCVTTKSAEEDEEVPATLGTRRPANRAERRKATAHAKNRRKDLAKYADDEIRTNSGKVINTGWRSYEKGNKVYTRKGRVTRDKFTEEPVTAEESVFTIRDTDLSLDTNSEIWTDEEISQAVEEYHTPWYEKYEDDEEEYDFGYDPYQNAMDDREAAWDEISKLNNEIETYKVFIAEYNLGKLYTQWKESF